MNAKSAATVAPTAAGAGFSLIEVVVALLVFCIGVLGVAGLTLRGLETLSDATGRTLAARAVWEAVDSLESIAGASSGSRPYAAGSLRWEPAATVGSSAVWIRVEAVARHGGSRTTTYVLVPSLDGEKHEAGLGPI